MWIYIINSFLSILRPDRHEETLLVRARRENDIEAIFPDAVVRATPERDYAFRAEINAEEVALAMAEAAGSIDYGNFKNSVQSMDRHHSTTRCGQSCSKTSYPDPSGMHFPARKERSTNESIQKS